MAGIRFKQFCQPDVLRGIGRELLRQFLEPFARQLDAKKFALPPAASSDTQYFRGVATILNCPAEIPPSLSEAVFALEDLAGPDGQERLQARSGCAGLESNLEWTHCPGQVGVQLWLLAPAVVLRANENLHSH